MLLLLPSFRKTILIFLQSEGKSLYKLTVSRPHWVSSQPGITLPTPTGKAIGSPRSIEESKMFPLKQVNCIMN